MNLSFNTDKKLLDKYEEYEYFIKNSRSSFVWLKKTLMISNLTIKIENWSLFIKNIIFSSLQIHHILWLDSKEDELYSIRNNWQKSS